MDINIEHIKDITIITLSGNLLGESDTEIITETFANSIENKDVNFIFDVKDLVYINSTGLSILISSLTKSRNAGGDLALVNIPTQLASLLKITKLESIFPNYGSREEAIEKLKAK